MRQYLETMRAENGYPDSFSTRFSSFGYRGHRSLEDAMWAGSAWSLFFQSSDDLHIAYHHPDAHIHSIPALAHKVVSPGHKAKLHFKFSMPNAELATLRQQQWWHHGATIMVCVAILFNNLGSAKIAFGCLMQPHAISFNIRVAYRSLSSCKAQ